MNIHAELQRLRTENANLRVLLHTDTLTGVPNRRAMDQQLPSALKQAVSVLLIDVDHFKAINDTKGHAAGDEALRTVAQVFKATLRDTDFLARTGGDEFMVLLPGTTGKDALVVAERIRSATESAGYSISVGLWVSEGDAHLSVEEATRRADMALYQAKGAGRNCVREWVSG